MSRSRRDGKKARSGALSQFGLFDIPDIDNMNSTNDDIDLNDDDGDLEAELNMILGSDSSKPLRPTRRAPGKPGINVGNLDSLIEASLKDEPSDEEKDDDDDPHLLAELHELTGGIDEMPLSLPEPLIPDPVRKNPTPASEPVQSKILQSEGDMVSLLKERLEMYTQAEEAAKQLNDTSKVRRYKRGLDQLKILLKRAEVGGDINQEDIPVPVVIPKASVVTLESQQPVYKSEGLPVNECTDEVIQGSSQVSHAQQLNKQELITMLTERCNQYKLAALNAKRCNDIESALKYIKIIKKFDVILLAVEKDQPFDLSTMPPPPPVPSSAVPPLVSPDAASSAPRSDQPSKPDESIPTIHEPPAEELTVLGALESRLAKYTEQEENAKREGNTSKARRMGRIVKQYKDAIDLHKRGKPFPLEELPTPPGFPPIPVEGSGSAPKSSPPSPGPTVNAESVPNSIQSEGKADGTPTSEELASPTQRMSLTPSSPSTKSSPSASPTPSQPSSKAGTQTRSERQMAVLLLRQREYREAALKAKQANDLVKAKEYLKLAMSFNSLIEATRAGLPVDMDTLPRPLSKKSPEEETFEIIRMSDCIEGSDSEIFDKLFTDLKNQLKMCIETLNHFKALGDIGNANRFENLASNTKKDYNTVRGAHASNSPVPKFHYEKRSFSIVRCNIDLNDNDLELSIIKGINYNVPNPKEIDTYIKYEFPYPNDEVRTEKTSTVYNTNNPEYNAVFLIPIQRSSRPFQRLFKRHSIKLHLWSKGGFLRSDQLVATAQVKLNALETKCTIHDSFDLMDGRRPLGGKIEVKIRLRNPILSKQIEQINEKWLVIN